MERFIQSTADGSHTISIPSMQLTYHSKHGAIQESLHVFIEAGWKTIVARNSPEISILEIGFGTGLNALLTLIEAGEKTVRYEALEAFPVTPELVDQLNYCEQLQRKEMVPLFELMHQCEWEQIIPITETFTFVKRKKNLVDFHSSQQYQLIYFDAFSPNVQPELWTTAIFSNLFALLEPNGLLVTYCSKSIVRRAMEEAGFKVEKISGPFGKREMVRATKPVGMLNC